MALFPEDELRYARPLAHALLTDPAVRRWVLAGTAHAEAYADAVPIADEQAAVRGARGPFWADPSCGRGEACRCRVGSALETDVMVVLQRSDGRRLALHIEVKGARGSLDDGQAEAYPRRAACWAREATRPRTIPTHQDTLTVLVAGRRLVADPRSRLFDKAIRHDDAMLRIPDYPRPAAAARDAAIFAYSAGRRLSASSSEGRNSSPGA